MGDLRQLKFVDTQLLKPEASTYRPNLVDSVGNQDQPSASRVPGEHRNGKRHCAVPMMFGLLTVNAWSEPAAPHEPEEVYGYGVRPPDPPPPPALQAFCADNPFHSVCVGPGMMSGTVVCPFTGASVSRPEECPEFGSSAAPGGCGYARSSSVAYSARCSSEPTNSQEAKTVFDCIKRNAPTPLEGWPKLRDDAPSSLADVTLRFEDLSKLAEARVGKNRNGKVVAWYIVLDADEIRREANKIGAHFDQVVAHEILHEYLHHLYGPNEERAESRAQEWYESLYGAPSPYSSRFRIGSHGKGSPNPARPCQ